MKYICSNCGHLQTEIGNSGGCAHDFWGICIFFTIFISLIYWVGFIVLAFEILFFILTSGKSNCCYKCKAKDCVIPVNTPRGEKLFNEYYEYEEIANKKEQEELKNDVEISSTDETEYTFTKIKVQKNKNWKELFKENENTLYILTIGILILIFSFLVLVLSNDSKTINQNNLQPKTEAAIENKSVSPIKKQPETLQTSIQLQAQYKAEIEKAITNGVTKAKNKIDEQYKEADEFYTNMISQENYSSANYEKYESYGRAFESEVFWLYVDLINITEKYTKQHKDLATDYYGTLADYIEPIMKKYHVSNIHKLTELETDMAQKSNEIDIRAQGIYKMVYGTNQ